MVKLFCCQGICELESVSHSKVDLVRLSLRYLVLLKRTLTILYNRSQKVGYHEALLNQEKKNKDTNRVYQEAK